MLKKTEEKSNTGLTQAPVINNAGIPTYVFYFATWCGFCHKMAPAVKKASEQYADRVYFHYIDIDSEEGKKFSKTYRSNGRGVPYGQYYDAQGKFIMDKIGLIKYEELRRGLEKLIKISN